MAQNDLILRGKALKDLRGIKDVLLAQGDPFLACIMNRAIECIENQPAAEAREDHARVAELEQELAAAVAYIKTKKDCSTCKHEMSENTNYCIGDCTGDCRASTCICRFCYYGSKWEWRGANGQRAKET